MSDPIFTDRLLIDETMVALVTAEERVRSLEADVETYRLMVSDLLTRCYSQNQAVERLMWRLRQVQEPARG